MLPGTQSYFLPQCLLITVFPNPRLEFFKDGGWAKVSLSPRGTKVDTNLSGNAEELWRGRTQVLWICGTQVPKSKSASYPVPEGLDLPDGVWEGFTVKLRG